MQTDAIVHSRWAAEQSLLQLKAEALKKLLRLKKRTSDDAVVKQSASSSGSKKDAGATQSASASGDGSKGNDFVVVCGFEFERVGEQMQMSAVRGCACQRLGPGECRLHSCWPARDPEEAQALTHLLQGTASSSSAASLCSGGPDAARVPVAQKFGVSKNVPKLVVPVAHTKEEHPRVAPQRLSKEVVTGGGVVIGAAVTDGGVGIGGAVTRAASKRLSKTGHQEERVAPVTAPKRSASSFGRMVKRRPNAAMRPGSGSA